MTFRQSLLAITLLAATSASAAPRQTPAADSTKSALVQIAGHATMDSRAFEYLTELSDNIGSRVTGTPEAQKAIDWSLEQMKSIGLQNVRAEKWSLWKGWARGSAQADMLAPLRHPLAVSAMGWTGSTAAGGVDADVAVANLFDLENEMKNASRF